MIVIVVLIAFPLISILILLIAAIHRKRSYPDKTFKNCVVNRALAPLRALRIGPYSQGKVGIDTALKNAVKATKLTDFGGTEFVDAYRRLEQTRTHSSLHFSNVGYIAGHMELSFALQRRLRLVQYFKKFPEILKIPVRSPVFVVGLPRTGTTFIHRLLSLDPAVRAPLLWELFDSCPDINSTDHVADRQRRANKVRAMLTQRKSLGDRALEHIHEVEADLPEECVLAFTDEMPILMQHLYTAYTEVDSWFNIVDHKMTLRTYKWYKQVLQVLSYQLGPKEAASPHRWMLKCPIHSLYLEEIKEVFPDAKLIWTHRHPVSSVPSMCSLVKAMHSVYYEVESRDVKAIGRGVSQLTAKMLSSSVTRQTDLEEAHVLYHEVVQDPVRVVQDIYKQFGWEYTPEYEKILKDYLKENSEKRHKVAKKKSTTVIHNYTPEEFSLSTDELTNSGVFGEYVRKFNLPIGKN